MMEQGLGEIDEELGPVAHRPAAQVDDAGPVAGGDQLGHVGAGVDRQRDVGMVAAEDDDGEARSLAAGGGFQSPPVALGINDADRLAVGEQALDQ
jgi:hypothetical protein